MSLAYIQQKPLLELIALALLIGVLLGVLLKKPIASLMQWSKQMLIFRLFNCFWRLLAPYNLFGFSLRIYRKKLLLSNLVKLENPILPGDYRLVPVDTTFAPLTLISIREALEQTDSRRRAEDIQLYPFLTEKKRVILLGAPGSGKTTILKYLLYSMLSGTIRSDQLKTPIPVFLELREIASTKDKSIKEAIIATFKKHGWPGARSFVDIALRSGRLVIMLDGLDEVGQSRDDIVQAIKDFAVSDDTRNASLVVTCRENSYRVRDLDDVLPHILRVEPFTPENVRTFLDRFPKLQNVHRSASGLYQHLVQHNTNSHEWREAIFDACRNPLMLSILASLYILFAQYDPDQEFQLPNSRNELYKMTLDELINQRPRRRQQKTNYLSFLKYSVLQSVSLKKLESLQEGEDAELIDRATLVKTALEIKNDINADQLLQELEEVNGIIRPDRPGADSSNYIFAHRTIQEYLAAKEAFEKRHVDDVVANFIVIPELLQVLYFYCGLNPQILQLEKVLSLLIEKEKWLIAGECLLSFTQTVDASLISKIVQSLYNEIFSETNIEGFKSRNVTIISALAQRKGDVYQSARTCYDSIVRAMVNDLGKDTGDLEAALISNPESAREKIPYLLKSTRDEQQKVAIAVLGKLGTDGDFRQLISLMLESTSPLQRRLSALAISEHLNKHLSFFRQEAAKLPNRTDPSIWPVNDYLPGSLAIPMIEALDTLECKNSTINLALEVYRLRTDESPKALARRRHWYHLERDMKRYKILSKVHTGVLISFFILATLIDIRLGFIAANVHRTHEPVALTSSFSWIIFPSRNFNRYADVYKKMIAEADSLQRIIMNAYPDSIDGVGEYATRVSTLPDDLTTASNLISDAANGNDVDVRKLPELNKLLHHDKLQNVSEANILQLQMDISQLQQDDSWHGKSLLLMVPPPKFYAYDGKMYLMLYCVTMSLLPITACILLIIYFLIIYFKDSDRLFSLILCLLFARFILLTFFIFKSVYGLIYMFYPLFIILFIIETSPQIFIFNPYLKKFYEGFELTKYKGA